MTIKSIDYGLIIDSNTNKCWLLNTQFYTILHNSTRFCAVVLWWCYAVFGGVMVVSCDVLWCHVMLQI